MVYAVEKVGSIEPIKSVESVEQIESVQPVETSQAPRMLVQLSMVSKYPFFVSNNQVHPLDAG